MPLVFAAITPHPPLLMPKIGKENIGKLDNTVTAMKHLALELHAAEPDSIIIISPHGPKSDKFTINLSPTFKANFQEFGDLDTSLEFIGDDILAQEIRSTDEKSEHVTLVSEPLLGHDVAVPLYFLLNQDKDVGVVPISHSHEGVKEHVEFGKFLHHLLMDTDKRVAIISSGDLSHKVTKDAPDGYSPKGKVFDQEVHDFVAKGKLLEVLKIKPKLIKAASQCGLNSIAVLAGALEHLTYKVEVLSYEAPFGVGYLVAHIEV